MYGKGIRNWIFMEPELMALGTEKLHSLSKRPNKRRSLKNRDY